MLFFFLLSSSFNFFYVCFHGGILHAHMPRFCFRWKHKQIVSAESVRVLAGKFIRRDGQIVMRLVIPLFSVLLLVLRAGRSQ